MTSMALTKEEFKQCLPPDLHGSLSPEVEQAIQDALTNPDTAHAIRDNLVGFTSVLQKGRFKMVDYINAVRYVSYRMMGDKKEIAFVKTFPERYNNWVKRGISKKDMSSYMTAYHKNKLVNLIYTQSLIPSAILNADIYQEAINTQAMLMRDTTVSAKVRSDAANSILNHLKRPEESKIEMSVEVKASSELAQLREITREFAEAQAKAIQNGSLSPKEAAEARIIDSTATEVDND